MTFWMFLSAALLVVLLVELWFLIRASREYQALLATCQQVQADKGALLQQVVKMKVELEELREFKASVTNPLGFQGFLGEATSMTQDMVRSFFEPKKGN